MKMFGNVTLDPLSQARPAETLKIKEILDLDTGQLLEARGFIRKFQHEAIIRERASIRRRWKTETPKLVCAICGVAVSLVGQTDKSWFFRHAIEDGSCPAETKSGLTYDEIRARKYHGLKESEPHKRVKRLLIESLSADQTFEEPKSESTIRSDADPNKYRRPDVQAYCGSRLVVFEVQLSTTFLDVVIARRMFYTEIGANLIWILPKFDPNYRRMTDDDIIFTNNNNVFVVDEETRDASITAGKFILKCWYREPTLIGGNIVAAWKTAFVPFADLQFSLERQTAFWFDYEDAVRKLEDEDADKARAVAQAALDAAERDDDELRDDFEALFLHSNWYREEFREAWHSLQKRFRRRGISLPDHPNLDRFDVLFNAIYTAKYGLVFGSGLPNLLTFAHNLYVYYKPFLLHFLFAAHTYGNHEPMIALDTSQKWANKWKEAKRLISLRDQTFLPSNAFHDVVAFLFPEVASQLHRFFDCKQAA